MAELPSRYDRHDRSALRGGVEPRLPMHAPLTDPEPDLPQALPRGTAEIGDSLETLAGLHAYNGWVFDQVREHVAGRVLEVGSGTGNLTRLLSRRARQVVALEPVDSFAIEAERRFAHRLDVEVRRGFLHELPEPERVGACFDAVVSFNVLEHIEDDVTALDMMRQQLRPGGRVIVFAPAGPGAFGELDRSLGHFRRYTVRSLRAAMARAGLEWVDGRYSNRVGYVGWWLNSVVLKRTEVPAQQAVAFNRVVPIMRLIDRLLPLPFGQSIVGVGRRPITDASALPAENPPTAQPPLRRAA